MVATLGDVWPVRPLAQGEPSQVDSCAFTCSRSAPMWQLPTSLVYNFEALPQVAFLRQSTVGAEHQVALLIEIQCEPVSQRVWFEMDVQ